MRTARTAVSVLFSEPKIPQFGLAKKLHCNVEGFSALQRAENSSMSLVMTFPFAPRSFSALQRAENSSMQERGDVQLLNVSVSVLFSEPKIPQSINDALTEEERERFSALQRAENSSISAQSERASAPSPFQCSSASRKFLNCFALINRSTHFAVSVLFSEPKIPQLIIP